MSDSAWHDRHSAASFARLLPRLEEKFATQVEPAEWEAYVQRLKSHFPRLFKSLHGLYGHYYDFFFHLEDIAVTATRMWIARNDELKALDATREIDPNWFQSNRMLGAMCYVDLFSNNLNTFRERIRISPSSESRTSI